MGVCLLRSGMAGGPGMSAIIIDQAVWVDRFALQLERLEVRAAPDMLVDLAHEKWHTMSELPPEEAARSEYEAWPSHND
jgi:hypothetical protein